LLHGVASVRGVRDVESRLQVHDTPGDVPALQGQPTRRLSGQQWDVMQVHWSPATRLLMGAAGGAMATFGAGRRDTFGGALTLTGLTLLTRALTNMELKRMLGVGAGRHAIGIQKSINLNAPVDRVFRLWANYQNFPYFMSIGSCLAPRVRASSGMRSLPHTPPMKFWPGALNPIHLSSMPASSASYRIPTGTLR
jgi:hypothetical protein